MNESFNLYNKNKDKEQEESTFKKVLFSYLIKTLLIIVIMLISLIYIRQNNTNKNIFKKMVYTNSISFARIYNIYNKYLGDVIPFKNVKEDNTKIVSSDKLTYNNINKKGNGYILKVGNEYAVPSISSGIVIEIKKDSKYKKLVSIQNKDGLVITYGYVENLNIKLYDYVEKGEIIGISNSNLYLIFKKDNKYVSYEKYL